MSDSLRFGADSSASLCVSINVTIIRLVRFRCRHEATHSIARVVFWATAKSIWIQLVYIFIKYYCYGWLCGMKRSSVVVPAGDLVRPHDLSALTRPTLIWQFEQ